MIGRTKSGTLAFISIELHLTQVASGRRWMSEREQLIDLVDGHFQGIDRHVIQHFPLRNQQSRRIPQKYLDDVVMLSFNMKQKKTLFYV